MRGKIAICAMALMFMMIAAFAMAETRFTIARVKYSGGGDWYANRTAIPNWLKGLRMRVGIETAEDQVILSLTDRQIYRYPLIFMTGHGNIKLSDEEARALRDYLTHGGFLFADDTYGMDKSFRREMKKVFPEKDLIPVPDDHLIYHCFYDLPGLPKVHEHDGDPAQGFAIYHDGRMVVFYTFSSDISDGLEDPEVHRDPPDVREQAMRMAINLAVYVLTH